jgi:hypothetical protein
MVPPAMAGTSVTGGGDQLPGNSALKSTIQTKGPISASGDFGNPNAGQDVSNKMAVDRATARPTVADWLYAAVQPEAAGDRAVGRSTAPTWVKAAIEEGWLGTGKRKFVPGEDCKHCKASMEKNEEGYCNSCGHEYDTGKVPAKGRYHEKAAGAVGRGGVIHKAIGDTVGRVASLPALLMSNRVMHDPTKKDRPKAHEDVMEMFSKVRPDQLRDVLLRLGGADLIDDMVWKKDRGEGPQHWSKRLGGRILHNQKAGPAGKALGYATAPLRWAQTAVNRSPHYDPFSDAANNPWDDVQVSEHELGHAIDFNNAERHGPIGMLGRLGRGSLRDLYTAAYGLPMAKLWHEAQANNQSLGALREGLADDPEQLAEREDARWPTLTAGYGSYIGGELSNLGVPVVGPLAGMVAGRIAGEGVRANRQGMRATETAEPQGEPQLKAAGEKVAVGVSDDYGIIDRFDPLYYRGNYPYRRLPALLDTMRAAADAAKQRKLDLRLHTDYMDDGEDPETFARNMQQTYGDATQIPYGEEGKPYPFFYSLTAPDERNWWDKLLQRPQKTTLQDTDHDLVYNAIQQYKQPKAPAGIKAANGDMLAFKAWKATGLSNEEADRRAGSSLALAYDDNGKPRASWAAKLKRLQARREIPGEKRAVGPNQPNTLPKLVGQGLRTTGSNASKAFQNSGPIGTPGLNPLGALGVHAGPGGLFGPETATKAPLSPATLSPRSVAKSVAASQVEDALAGKTKPTAAMAPSAAKLGTTDITADTVFSDYPAPLQNMFLDPSQAYTSSLSQWADRRGLPFRGPGGVVPPLQKPGDLLQYSPRQPLHGQAQLLEKQGAVHPFRPVNADPDFIAASRDWFEVELARLLARRRAAA